MRIAEYPLPFAEDALEPFMDARTLFQHNRKFFVGYQTQLQAALNHFPILREWPEEYLIAHIRALPGGIRRAVRNNGGGVVNHRHFYSVLRPGGPHPIPQPLADVLAHRFGSLMRFKEEFASVAAGRFGVGWCWLILTEEEIYVGSTINQDNPLMPHADIRGVPLLGLDLWEHAYFLCHENRRPSYIQAFWNVIDWDVVYARYLHGLELRAQHALLPVLTEADSQLLEHLRKHGSVPEAEQEGEDT
ncbi:MAG: superoxide dismutase [Bacteroidetes bacterium]|nr:superoxide dismutase [Bacteroidota bacterium]